MQEFERMEARDSSFRRNFQSGRELTAGLQKLKEFCDTVKTLLAPDVDWIWIDSLCIDKTNSAELSYAINSMLTWYQNSAVCLVHLADCDRTFSAKSAWFRRGWTLQELIAPEHIIFLSSQWSVIGCKKPDFPRYQAHRSLSGAWGTQMKAASLNERLSEITGIPLDVLSHGIEYESIHPKVKLSWMSRRKTTRQEDFWYCQIGLFGISLSPIYGEGREKAWQRFLHAIEAQHGSKLCNACEQASIAFGQASKLIYRPCSGVTPSDSDAASSDGGSDLSDAEEDDHEAGVIPVAVRHGPPSSSALGAPQQHVAASQVRQAYDRMRTRGWTHEQALQTFVVSLERQGTTGPQAVAETRYALSGRIV